MGKVTARIPWPNPLTSTIGLSLESLHLTFIVSATQQTPKRVAVSNIADSVASVAESFMHDELDTQEEATLMGSIHSELSGSGESLDHVPGGLDPFLSEDESHTEGEPSGVSIFATLVERLLSRFEFDSTDLKITLVHPEHASFTLNVPAIQYRTRVKDAHLPSSSQANANSLSTGVTRSIHISGVTISTRCLRPPSPQPLVPSASPSASAVSFATRTMTPGSTAHSPTLPSPISDTSDLDEETTMFMSQSLAGLPPRPISPSSSVSSSMYQSAVSIAPGGRSTAIFTPTSAADQNQPDPRRSPAISDADIRPKLDIVTEEIEDELLFSLGNEPIVLQLWTPSHAGPRSSDAEMPSSSYSGPPPARPSRRPKNPEPKEPGLVKLDATIGVVSLALRARHIRAIIDLANLWGSHVSTRLPDNQSPPNLPSRPSLQRVDTSLRLRGLVIALLPVNVTSTARKETLSQFFAHPLIPPHSSHGYVRIHLDEFLATASMQPSPPPATSRPTSRPGNTITVHASLTDLSTFSFIRAGETRLSAIPLMIVDPHLPSQYGPTHVHPNLRDPNPATRLPEFDVLDWTNPMHQTTSAKLSTWRTKPQYARGPSVSTSPRSTPRNLTGMSPLSPTSPSTTPKGTGIQYNTTQSALTVKVSITSASSSHSGGTIGKNPASGVDVEINLAPLHLFADVSQVLVQAGSFERGEVLLFLDEVTSSSNTILQQTDLLDTSTDEDEEDEELSTPPTTPRARQVYSRQREERARERERLRLERLVLEDLDLGFDYGQVTPGPSAQPMHSSRRVGHFRRVISRTDNPTEDRS